MKKIYLVQECAVKGDEYQRVFATEKEAIADAKSFWDYSTKDERKNIMSIDVGIIEVRDGETDEEAVDRTLVDESSIGDVIFEITNEGGWMA